MRQGGADGEVTDQLRVYAGIVHALPTKRCLRMMVQASAGTGKSFLLTTIYLWCLVHGMPCRAAAPTGIAAANIEIDGTDICAATLHHVFDLDSECKSNLDFTKPGADKVAAILRMKVLFLDEARPGSRDDICAYELLIRDSLSEGREG